MPSAAAPLVRHAVRAIAPPRQAGAILAANLRAISRRQPDLADRLAAVDISESIRFMLGRDGTATAQAVDAVGRWRWLGCSSVPTLSAGPVAAQFTLEQWNLSVVGIGSGWELVELARRMHYHQAVFCLLDDGPGLDGLAAGAAALRLADLADLLAAGRVILGADAGAGSLGAFLDRHPGFCPPGQILRWPWQTGEQFVIHTARLDRIGRARLDSIQREIGSVHVQFGRMDRSAGEPGEIRRVMAIGPGMECPARLAVQGLASAADEGFCYLIDGPDGAAGLAQAQAIARFRPDLLVLVDRTRRDLVPAPPACCQVASWLTDSGVQAGGRAGRILAGLGESDLIFAATETIEQAMLSAGHPRERVFRLPPASNDGLFAPGTDQPRHGMDDGQGCPSPDPECDVAIIADVTPVDAEQVGLEWPSHRRLWNECIRQIQADPAGYSRAQAGGYLARAGRACGVVIRDEAVSARFAEAVQAVGGPPALRLAFARGVLESLGRGLSADCRVRLVGDGWEGSGLDSAVAAPRPRRWADWRSVFNSAALAVFVNDTLDASQEMLDAAACGATLLVRRPGGGAVGQIGGLFRWGSEIVGFVEPGELVSLIRRLLSCPHERLAIGRAARLRVQAEHLYTHRLEEIIRRARSARRGSESRFARG